MEQADLIYVNDYCYYIWWLAAVHSHGAASDELLVPANALLEVCSIQLQHQRMPTEKPHGIGLAVCSGDQAMHLHRLTQS